MIDFKRFYNIVLTFFAFRETSADKWTSSAMERLIDDRSGIWAYTGSLYDSITGSKIVNVEGIEVVKPIGSTKDYNFRGKVRELKVSECIDGGVSAFSLISRKLFCYKALDQPRTLLSEIRLRPQGPSQYVPASQASTAYETVTSYLEKNDQLICHTEFADGKTFWSQVNDIDFVDWLNNNRLEYSVMSKGPLDRLPDWRQAGNVTKSPARSKLIQFGASDVKPSIGARETYEYRLSGFRREPTVRYTRYGEGPAWYGPNRMCVLELKGRRVKRWDDVPPVAAKFAAERIPGFSSMSLDWFHKNSFQVLDDDIIVDNPIFHWIERIRQATTLKLGKDA